MYIYRACEWDDDTRRADVIALTSDNGTGYARVDRRLSQSCCQGYLISIIIIIIIMVTIIITWCC
jgi:hypothetical protein